MPDFSFLKDDSPDDGAIRIRTTPRREPVPRQSPPLTDQLNELSNKLMGCGCALITLGLMLLLPMILLFSWAR